MGTRNLTVVYSGGKHVVAQYGQWDGYPSGQGAVALEFCRNYLQKQIGRDVFKKKLELCKFAGLKGYDDHDVDSYYMSRDFGAKILDAIADAHPSDGEVLLEDSLPFAADSLFCEWAYVIDLDKNTFEVYRGFNKKPLDPSERFANVRKNVEDDDGVSKAYCPVKLVVSYNLDELPTYSEFFEFSNMLAEKEDQEGL